MNEVLGYLVITAIQNAGAAASQTLQVLGASEDENGNGTFKVRNEDGDVYLLVEKEIEEEK